MAGVTNNLKDWKEMYDGFNAQDVGIGLSNPNIYHSTAYALKKQHIMLLGCISDIIYSGFEHDQQPQVLSIAYEPQYNTIIGYNLHYVPQTYRQAIVKLVVASNKPRMLQNLPVVIDYRMIQSQVPASEHIIRRYKVTGINVVGNVPLKDWGKAILGKNPWQNWYKDQGKPTK